MKEQKPIFQTTDNKSGVANFILEDNQKEITNFAKEAS